MSSDGGKCKYLDSGVVRFVLARVLLAVNGVGRTTTHRRAVASISAHTIFRKSKIRIQVAGILDYSLRVGRFRVTTAAATQIPTFFALFLDFGALAAVRYDVSVASGDSARRIVRGGTVK